MALSCVFSASDAFLSSIFSVAYIIYCPIIIYIIAGLWEALSMSKWECPRCRSCPATPWLIVSFSAPCSIFLIVFLYSFPFSFPCLLSLCSLHAPYVEWTSSPMSGCYLSTDVYSHWSLRNEWCGCICFLSSSLSPVLGIWLVFLDSYPVSSHRCTWSHYVYKSWQLVPLGEYDV